MDRRTSSNLPDMLLVSFTSAQPSSGGKETRNERIQTKAIIILARREVMMLLYLTGRVTAKYRSTLIAQRFRMEAVESQTSITSQPKHQKRPKIQTSRTWQIKLESVRGS